MQEKSNPSPILSQKVTHDNNLGLGNPLMANSTDFNNLLIDKGTYILSYNANKTTANWVSWHLTIVGKETATHYSGSFLPNSQLPSPI